MGLEAAIDELADKILHTHGIETEYEDDEIPKPLDNDVRVLLFQSVRELLTNVVKHAQAHRVKIDLRKAEDNIQITVEDDGVGFDTGILSPEKRSGGFGFFSIRERLVYIGGSIDVISERGKGTRITLTAPIKKNRGKGEAVSN